MPASQSNHGKRTRGGKRQQGIAMLEVLISILLIALWMLASAGMQVGMFKLQKGADSRLRAIALVSELGERMEANTAGAKAGSYVVSSLGSVPSFTTDCATAACSAANLAAFDLKQWSDRVTSTLQGSTAVVSQVTAAGITTYTITLSWTEQRGRQTYSTAGQTETASFTTVKVLG